MKINQRLSEKVEMDAEFEITRVTEIVEMSNGFEERNAPQAYQRRHARITYGVKKTAEIIEIRNAWSVVKDKSAAFRFRDWSDYKTSDHGAAVAGDDQDIGIGDAVAVNFQMTRKVGFGGGFYTHPVKAPVSSTIIVQVDGVAQVSGVDYNVDSLTGIITFTVAPGVGLSVTYGAEFDVWMRFVGDKFGLSHLLYVEDDSSNQVSRTGSIELIEVLE